MKKYRWAIIGPGNIAKQFTNDLGYSKYQHEVTTIVGHSQEGIQEYIAEFGRKRVYTDYNDFIKEADVDVVYVATPHPFHFKTVLACLKKNIPVLCEKPLVLNAKQAKELINISVSNHVFLMEAMWIRFLPSIMATLSALTDNDLGDVLALRASISYRAPLDDNNRYFNPDKGGGSLLDLGVYAIFLSLLIFGKPKTIKTIGNISNQGIDEAVAVLLHFENGSYAMLDSSLKIEMKAPAEIYCSKGTVSINDPWFEKAKGIDILRDGKMQHIDLNWEGHGLYFQVDEVIQQLEAGKIESEKMPHSLSLMILEVMDNIREQIGVTYENFE